MAIREEEIVDIITPYLDKARAHREELAVLDTESADAYHFEPYGNEREGFSTTVDSVAYDNVEWLKSNLVAAFDGDWFSLASRDQIRADRIKEYLKYLHFRKQNGKRINKDWIHDALLYPQGGIVKVYYKEDYDLEPVKFDKLGRDEFLMLQADPELTVTKYTEVEEFDPVTNYYWSGAENVKAVRRVVSYQGACAHVIPPWEFFFIPGYRSLAECPFTAHKRRMTLDEVRKREKAGIFKKGSYDAVKDKVESILADTDSSDEIERYFDNAEVFFDAVTDLPGSGPMAGNQEVIVFECSCKMDIDDDGLLEWAFVTVCGDVVLTDPVENKYKAHPYIQAVPFKEPHRMEQRPLPKVLENEQKQQTNLKRLMVDSAAESVHHTLVTRDPQLQRQWSARVVGDSLLGDPGGAQVMQAPTPSQYILRAIEKGQEDIERKTGVTSYTQGLNSDALNKTATGITAVMSSAQQRMKYLAENLAESFEELVRRYIQILQLYPPQNEIFRLTDGQEIAITEDDARGEFDIEISIGAAPAEKMAMAQQLDMHVQFLTQVGIQMGIADPSHVVNAIVRKFKLLDIPAKDLLYPQEQVQQMIQQQQAQAQQQAMQQEMMQNGGNSGIPGIDGAGQMGGQPGAMPPGAA